jgi:putative transposase
VHDVWGDAVLVHRGPMHKPRTVRDHLPQSADNRIRPRCRTAYHAPEADTTAQAFEALATELARDHPGAAGSLREGLAETFTVHRWGLPGLWRQTLANTNALESSNRQLRTHAHNVTHGPAGHHV